MQGSSMPSKSSIRTNKTHKLIKWLRFTAVYRNFFKKDIFKNKQQKSYQSSKILTPNERAQRNKKKEPKIAKNNGEMRENQKEGKMEPSCGYFRAEMRKKMTRGYFKALWQRKL